MQIGKVGRSHGIKGSFFLAGRDEAFIEKLSVVKVGAEFSKSEEFKVEKISPQSAKTIFKLVGIDSRTDSEKILHYKVWAKRDELNLADDEYFWSDLAGKNVALPNGEIIGKSSGLNNFGASDVMEIKNSSGQTMMLPFVSAYFDIDASIDSEVVQLCVEIDVIEELWTGGKSK